MTRGHCCPLRRRRTDAQREAAAAFQRENRERFDAPLARYGEIMAELGAIATRLKDDETGRPMTVEGLMRAYPIAMERFETYGRKEGMYVNYRIAMLQPGLSPEQRRLLFGSVLVGLAQPLPDGEPSPVGMRLHIRS